MRNKILLFALVAGVLAGCGNKQTEQAAPKEVKIRIAQLDSVSVPLRAPAQLHGKQDIAIVPQVSATIEEVLVQEGDRVEKGQRMFVLNQTAFQAAVDNAAAGVKGAEADVQTQALDLDAKRQLLEKNIISRHEYQVQENKLMMARAALAEAQAALKHAKNELGFTTIKAPHTGVVGVINYKQGALVSPNIAEPMTIVSDNSVVYANISIAGDYYLYLLNEYGSKEQMLRELPDFSLILGEDVYYSQPGRMETVSGIIDQSTGAVSCRIAFPNPNGVLTAGGNGQVEVKYVDEAIVLPRNAVFAIQDKNYVFAVEKQDENTFVLRQTLVEVYRLSETEYVVESGLKAGDMVVAEGVKKLSNGEEVRICEGE